MAPAGAVRRCSTCAALLALGLLCTASPWAHAKEHAPKPILVVGSLNVDIIVEVGRLPAPGETITSRRPAAATAVGGKGANQAVAVARLSTHAPAKFVCRFGNDSYGAMLEAELVQSGVDVSACLRTGLPSGQGIVLLEPDGSATSIVLPGANTAFEQEGPEAWAPVVKGAGAVLLQREVPEHVNEAVAAAAAAAGVPVLLDVGGEDRPISDALLSRLDYVAPNESELARLTGLPTDSEEQVLAAAASLRARGARAVLATMSHRGALLLTADGAVLQQAALPVPGGTVVDATAAGDSFRAAFAVALVEGLPLQDCLRFAAAAGAVAVSRMGAVPSLPTRAEVEQQLAAAAAAAAAGGSEQTGTGTGTGSGGSAASSSASSALPAPTVTAGGSSCLGPTAAGAGRGAGAGEAPTCSAHAAAQLPPPNTLPIPAECPYRFASRLNSMHARRDLAGQAHGSDDVLGWIRRQSLVRGLSLVDLNHPQHTTAAGLTPDQLRGALEAAGLAAGAICTRFPSDFLLGALSNPDGGLRRRAVEIGVEGCRWAAALGARDLIVWSPYDGYDYHFQVDYNAAWQRTVEAFRALADGCAPAGVRVSLEWKPTDESTRYSVVPSTGAALLLARQVARPNFGLTLDLGHLLMAGENPAQSAALAAAEGRLFGLQLNDAHVKLGAEDGLAFGAVGGAAALELVRWLQRVGYDGHIYFDTFPKKEDPIREAEYNIRRFKALWRRAARLAAAGIDGFAATHDAMGALELLEADEEGVLPRRAAAAGAARGAGAATAVAEAPAKAVAAAM